MLGFILLGSLIPVCLATSAVDATTTATSVDIDAKTEQRLDTIWDQVEVSGDFEKVCSYKKSKSKTIDLGNSHDLASSWQDRQILFRSNVGTDLPETSMPSSLQYFITNSITHDAGTTRVRGGCKWGTGVDPGTRVQMKGNALYDVEEPKNFIAGEMYRNQMTTAKVDLTEWFAWHTNRGAKFALKISYTEHLHNPMLPVPQKWGKYQRYQTDLKCQLYYRPAGKKQKAVTVKAGTWSSYVHLINEHTNEKRLLEPCST